MPSLVWHGVFVKVVLDKSHILKSFGTGRRSEN